MKVDIFYLSLPEDLYSKFPKNMVEDFSIVKGSLNSLPKMYNRNSERWHYMYAFTNDCKLSDIFQKTHDMKLFIKITKSMTKDEYSDFLKEYKLSRIVMHKVDEEGDEFILCTKNESYEFEDSFHLYINEIIMENSLMDYSQFNEEYIQALDKILYCTNNKINGEDSEYYSYNLSYGITAEGYGTKYIISKPNVLSLYIKLYALLLRKEH